ncbi:probable serine/threonine-protein kinase DDB_G0272282 [Teleopsis dalmanni]|uniref:probable serine/threonine-protein kinase DDB_G0272282 n=1 Tax=Teleopsis dalmanni TaxID=139649 RepID=UPI0018CE2579|nr:probable serine/threonine-protein kinase DDB_G0272282 [Teleopsis dalmanni]
MTKTVETGISTVQKKYRRNTVYETSKHYEWNVELNTALIIKNWKPIPLEQISDNPTIPVCDIIGELTSVVTLRIVILRTKTSPFGEIKDKLLKLLVLQSHAVLRSTGCPLDESILSQLCRISYQNAYAFPDISEDIRRKFEQWWSNQLSPQAAMTPKMLPFMAVPQPVANDMDFKVGSAAVAAAAAAAAAQAGLHAASSNASVSSLGVPTGINASHESLMLNEHGGPGVPGNSASHHPGMLVHPAMHASMHHHHHHSHSQYPNQKTRMRTSFDPEMELPKLQKWFQENPHPSRQQIQTYVVQLNALESRRGRKPLDVNNVVYWFKNARAAQKRAEMRGGLGAIGALGHVAMNGYLSQHGQLSQNSGSSAGSITGSQQLSGVGMPLAHDYLKSPLSLKSEDIDTMSQHSDDMDEDTSRPCSPQLPLSLTTHERNRNSPTNNDEHCAESRRTSSSKDENDTHNLINGTPLQMERSCSRDYNEEDTVKREKDIDENIESNKSDTVTTPNDVQQNENETNNNSTNSNNNNNSNPSNEQVEQDLAENSSPKHITTKEEDDYLDMDEDDEDNENDTSQLDDFRSPSPDMTNSMADRKDLQFPMVPNSMFSQSFMYMSHYMPGFGQAAAGHPHTHHAIAAAAGMQQSPLMSHSGLNLSSLSNEERRKRNRTFIDPVTEVPKLEQWFAMNTHPSHNLILKYTEDLNTMPYRQKFPRLESKNVQFWFKNRRAKCKRLKMSLYDNSQFPALNSFVHKYDERD